MKRVRTQSTDHYQYGQGIYCIVPPIQIFAVRLGRGATVYCIVYPQILAALADPILRLKAESSAPHMIMRAANAVYVCLTDSIRRSMQILTKYVNIQTNQLHR